MRVHRPALRQHCIRTALDRWSPPAQEKPGDEEDARRPRGHASMPQNIQVLRPAER